MSCGWGYAKANGPDTWQKEFPLAAGKSQSPIAIKVSECQPDSGLKPIKVEYSKVEVGELANTGSSWKAQVTSGIGSLTGGPLSNKFALEQFHAHWGCVDKQGSEHTINDVMYSAELHLVHWDTEKYKSFGEAASQRGGLAVLGMFLKIGKAHPELEKLTKLIKYISYKNQNINLTDTIDCAKFLPNDLSYYTYDGSLTTPPCYESVNWIVFEEPIEISKEQLDAMRAMKSFFKGSGCPCDELKGCMIDNNRPVCPINGRKVRVFRQKNEE